MKFGGIPKLSVDQDLALSIRSSPSQEHRLCAHFSWPVLRGAGLQGVVQRDAEDAGIASLVPICIKAVVSNPMQQLQPESFWA